MKMISLLAFLFSHTTFAKVLQVDCNTEDGRIISVVHDAQAHSLNPDFSPRIYVNKSGYSVPGYVDGRSTRSQLIIVVDPSIGGNDVLGQDYHTVRFSFGVENTMAVGDKDQKLNCGRWEPATLEYY